MFYVLYKVLRSFTYAFAGLAQGFTERNMRVHGIMAVLAILLGLVVGLSTQEWLWVIGMIGAVFSAELINTSIESMCNVMRDELGAKYVSTGGPRDMAAAAVFVLATVAAIGGCVIFVPKLLVLFS